MITAILTVVPVTIAGWALVRLALPRETGRSAWAQAVLEISLGCVMGVGIASLLFFVLTWTGAANRVSILAAEFTTAGGAVAWLLRRRPRARASEPPPRFAWTWVLRLCVVAAMLVFLVDFSGTKAANPHGGWDAFSIWNARAKFLAGGADTWRNALSKDQGGGLFGASHPGYPLLLSGAVARTWMALGSWTPEAPAGLGLLFALAAVGVLFGALARERSESAGLLAALLLLGTSFFVYQAAMQYSDIPLGCFLLGWAALTSGAADRGWPRGMVVLAGACLGLAAWTKNEGIVFLAFALGAVLWRGGARAAAWMTAAAAAPALATAALKTLLASPTTETLLPKTAAEVFAKLSDPSRWWVVASSFVSSFWQLEPSWMHPAVLAAVLGVALRFDKASVRARLPLLIPVAGLLATDFVLYVTTTARDLRWAVDTSSTRLLVQVWPAAILIFFLMLRPPVTPEEQIPMKAEARRRSKGGKGRRQSTGPMHTGSRFRRVPGIRSELAV